MNHFTNQSNGSHCGHSLMGRAMLRRFALFPMMLLMLLLLPAGMVAQKAASSSKYIATYDSESATLTFEKYEGESLPANSKWVENGMLVFNEFFDLLRQKTIKHIVLNESFKTFTPTTLSQFFAGLTNLETITGLEYLNTANVTNMTALFANCRKLTSLDLSHFNTAKVTNMYRMFDSCGLTSLDLSNFNTAKVTDMEFMFRDCSNLKTIYASENFITAAVTYSNSMFASCNSLSGDIDWSSDKAADKTYAKTDGGYFRDKAYDNRPWVKYADGTLTFRCGYKKTWGENEYALNSGEEKPAWNTQGNNITRVVFDASFANARPTTCYAWFQSFYNLTQIEGIENLNTENVTNMSNMFGSCYNLAELDVTHFNTANVMDMHSMFFSCSGLTSLDVTNFNTANVWDMGSMFYGCHNLKEIYVSDKFVTDVGINCYQMFAYCESLSGDIDWTLDKPDDQTYAKLDGGYFRDKAYANRPWVKFADGTLTFRCGYKKTLGENEYELNSGTHLPAWYGKSGNITKAVFDASFANARPTSCYLWFYDFGNLKQIEGIENLNTTNVTEMASMFYGCSQLTSLDVTHFNTENVVHMENMFTNCSSLASLDVTHFNTENVANMGSMFYGCSSLTSLDVTNFNTANVSGMNHMFSGCSSLTSLDVTNFNTANVLAMNDMFSGCSALTTIYASDKFVMAKVDDESVDMFKDCTNLKGAITEYDESKTDYRFANYKTGYFTKLVGKNGDEKIGAAGETLATENLVLDDNKDFVAYEPFAAKAASYSRTINAGTKWATLCLPFEVSLANQNFRAFKLLSADDAAETVELEEIETSIAAGTPVIIKMKDGETELSFTVANKEIANEVKTAETANGNYQLQGLYTQKVFSKDTDNNCYIVKGEKLMNPAKLLEKTTTKFVGSKPFRAYMVDKSSAPVAGARMFSIRLGDGTTGIKQLEADTVDGKTEYYDLQGHRLQDLQKGVNIVKRGGKTMKVVIK